MRTPENLAGGCMSVCAGFRALRIPWVARPKRSCKGHFAAFCQWHEMRKEEGNNLLKAVRSTPFMLLAKGGRCPPPHREAVPPIRTRSGPPGQGRRNPDQSVASYDGLFLRTRDRPVAFTACVWRASGYRRGERGRPAPGNSEDAMLDSLPVMAWGRVYRVWPHSPASLRPDPDTPSSRPLGKRPAVPGSHVA
jgi:hypothetical protein